MRYQLSESHEVTWAVKWDSTKKTCKYQKSKGTRMRMLTISGSSLLGFDFVFKRVGQAWKKKSLTIRVRLPGPKTTPKATDNPV